MLIFVRAVFVGGSPPTAELVADNAEYQSAVTRSDTVKKLVALLKAPCTAESPELLQVCCYTALR